MRTSTIITISNVQGSKSYTVGELTKKITKFLIAGLVLLILGGAGVIWFLTDRITEYQKVETKYHNLLIENSNLEISITRQKEHLNSLENKVSDIEAMIGIDQKEDVEIDSRLDIANLSARDRLLMLTTIPSGHVIPYNGITSKYGWRRNPLTKSKQFHTGIDLRAKIGTPIKAAADGVIETARRDGKKGYGKLIIMNHAMGFKTLYAHLNKVKVKVGEFVQKGQIIGYTGNSGYSSGPHLHYEVRYIGKTLDPYRFMRWNLQNYASIFKKEGRVKWQSLVKGIEWQWTQLKRLSSHGERTSTAKSNSDVSSISTVKSKEP